MKHFSHLTSLIIWLFSIMCIPVISDAITVEISPVDILWRPKASTKKELSIASVNVTISDINTNKDQLKVIQITLERGTYYSGICCNSRIQDIEDTGLKDVYDNSNGSDLIFRQEENDRWEVVGNLTLRYQIPRANTPEEVILPVGVLSLDYGGYGELHASIYKVKGLLDKLEFEFGTDSQKKKYTLQENVQGYTQVPRDENYNGIADSWYKDRYALDINTGDLDEAKFRNFGKKDDKDTSHDSNYIGDNITAFEEYRGFIVITSRPGTTPVTVSHTDTSPDIKDMFVVNEDREIASYGVGVSLPHISQYLLPSSRVKANGQVTFNNYGKAYSAKVVSDSAIGGNTSYGHAPMLLLAQCKTAGNYRDKTG